MSGPRLYTIFAEGLEVMMLIGIYPDEKAARQRVVVGIAAECLLEDDCISRDDIVGTVSYEGFIAAVRDKAESGHYNLVERFCEEVASTILTDARVQSVRVRCTKPDIFKGNPECVGVEITRFGKNAAG